MTLKPATLRHLPDEKILAYLNHGTCPLCLYPARKLMGSSIQCLSDGYLMLHGEGGGVWIYWYEDGNALLDFRIKAERWIAVDS